MECCVVGLYWVPTRLYDAGYLVVWFCVLWFELNLAAAAGWIWAVFGFSVGHRIAQSG